MGNSPAALNVFHASEDLHRMIFRRTNQNGNIHVRFGATSLVFDNRSIQRSDCVVVRSMFRLLDTQVPLLVAVDDQAIRAADAGWETARWTFWLFVATALLVAGAGVAAYFAWKTWTATKGQLDVASEQLEAAQTERDNSNEQLQMARDAAFEREAVNVSAWLTQENGGTINCFVRNGNDGPIYDVGCVVSVKKSADDPMPSVFLQRWHQMAVRPNTAFGFTDFASAFLQDLVIQLGSDEFVGTRIDPADRAPVTASGSKDVKVPTMAEWKIWDLDARSTGVAVEVTFRDSMGHLWWRDWEGKLAKMHRSTDGAAG